MAMAAAEEYSPKVRKRTLKGHRKQVLCLAHSSERLAYYFDSKTKITALTTNTNKQSERGHVHHPTLLLSGSEDGTARLWDLRMRRTALCMAVPAKDNEGSTGVVSVAFHPSIAVDGQSGTTSNNKEGEECNDALIPFQHDCTVYASTANNIYGYDLRHHYISSTSPIMHTPHFDLSSLFQCSDEINQLAFSFPKQNDGSGSCFMSAADDSGEARVAECLAHRFEQNELSNATTKKCKIFNHAQPDTMAITSSALFQPRTKDHSYLVTGGTDCNVKLWDINRPRRPTCTVQIEPAQNQNTTQLCNPPYVHSLSWSSSGRLLVAGIGDGSCAIFRAEGRRLVEIGRLGYDEGGHRSAVAAVCFANFGLCEHRRELSSQLPPKVRKSGEAEDRLVISAGNDGNIHFWDLGGNMVGSGPLNPVLYLKNCFSPCEATVVDEGCNSVKDTDSAMNSPDTSSQNSNNKNEKGKDSNNDYMMSGDMLPSPPRVLFKIQHEQKPNWITFSRASDIVLPLSLFVADTTNNISVYTLPQ